MNEFKGTPGPWKAKENGFYLMAVVDSKGNYLTYKAGTDRMAMRELEANARLIAAAPELLEALQLAFGMAKIFHRDTDEVWAAAKQQIESAIAKALGEQQ